MKGAALNKLRREPARYLIREVQLFCWNKIKDGNCGQAVGRRRT